MSLKGSIRPQRNSGAWGRVRTADTLGFNQVLYQLSYPSKSKSGFNAISGTALSCITPLAVGQSFVRE